ncbi:hypothetical protein ACHAWF_011433, partial [Thalassiosira exigua]
DGQQQQQRRGPLRFHRLLRRRRRGPPGPPRHVHRRRGRRSTRRRRAGVRPHPDAGAARARAGARLGPAGCAELGVAEVVGRATRDPRRNVPGNEVSERIHLPGTRGQQHEWERRRGRRGIIARRAPRPGRGRRGGSRGGEKTSSLDRGEGSDHGGSPRRGPGGDALFSRARNHKGDGGAGYPLSAPWICLRGMDGRLPRDGARHGALPLEQRMSPRDLEGGERSRQPPAIVAQAPRRNAAATATGEEDRAVLSGPGLLRLREDGGNGGPSGDHVDAVGGVPHVSHLRTAEPSRLGPASVWMGRLGELDAGPDGRCSDSPQLDTRHTSSDRDEPVGQRAHPVWLACVSGIRSRRHGGSWAYGARTVVSRGGVASRANAPGVQSIGMVPVPRHGRAPVRGLHHPPGPASGGRARGLGSREVSGHVQTRHRGHRLLLCSLWRHVLDGVRERCANRYDDKLAPRDVGHDGATGILPSSGVHVSTPELSIARDRVCHRGTDPVGKHENRRGRCGPRWLAKERGLDALGRLAGRHRGADHGRFGQGGELDGKPARMSAGVRPPPADSESVGQGTDRNSEEAPEHLGFDFGSRGYGSVFNRDHYKLGVKLRTKRGLMATDAILRNHMIYLRANFWLCRQVFRI